MNNLVFLYDVTACKLVVDTFFLHIAFHISSKIGSLKGYEFFLVVNFNIINNMRHRFSFIIKLLQVD